MSKTTLKFAEWCRICLKPTFGLESHINTVHKEKTPPVEEIMPWEKPKKKKKSRATTKPKFRCVFCNESFFTSTARDEHVIFDRKMTDEISNGNNGVR